MTDAMHLLAQAAHRFGGVDARDENAVIEFLERSSDKIPDDEAEKLVAALLHRDQPAADVATEIAFEPDAGPPRFPSLRDARRDAALYEQIQRLKSEPRDLVRAPSQAVAAEPPPVDANARKPSRSLSFHGLVLSALSLASTMIVFTLDLSSVLESRAHSILTTIWGGAAVAFTTRSRSWIRAEACAGS